MSNPDLRVTILICHLQQPQLVAIVTQFLGFLEALRSFYTEPRIVIIVCEGTSLTSRQ